MYVDCDPADNARETGFTSVENLRLDRNSMLFLDFQGFPWTGGGGGGAGNPERLLSYAFDVERRIFAVFVCPVGVRVSKRGNIVYTQNTAYH